MVGGLSYHPYRQYATTSQPIPANIGKRERTKFRPDQLQYLEIYFNTRSKYPQGPEREALANDLRLTETVIQVWFKNRRAKEKADKKFHDLRLKVQTGANLKQLHDSPVDPKKEAYDGEEHPAEPGGTEEENEAPKPGGGNKLLPACYPAHMPFIPLPPTMPGTEGAKQEEPARTVSNAPTTEVPLSQTGHSWSPQAAWMHMNTYSSMFPFPPTAYPSGFSASTNGYPNFAALPYADQFAYAPGYYNPATTMSSVLPHTANYFKFP